MARIESGTELVDRLVSSYAVETDIYRSLRALTQEQGALLEAGEVDRCAQLFERKDELLRSLARIEVEIEPLKRRWQTDPIETADRDRLNNLLDAILATIEAIMEQEQRNEQLLLSRHREVEADLGAISRAATLTRAQAHEDSPVPRFMDIER
jgi:flagellar biosynthesis/type III secretory pathway chaperone